MGDDAGDTGPPSRAPGPDPRPLLGEPLSLDLLNTRWIDGGTRHDLLEDLDGFGVWLAGHGLLERTGATPAALTATLRAREALQAVVADPGDGCAREGLNAVLARGRVLRSLGPEGPAERAETDDPAWLAAWLAADDYLRLVGAAPDRVRACANDGCVLHFYDVSRNGTRRWCSMSGCGNRAKASRHYARARRREGR
ncbi:CGNR zinc finger domain-containing protein [Streptomyces verrucosisporus]|uniref:CGNR zinc finger domain-containing protein n=1 Tax=Streptomyces verrucosisporus TaxID=1695161 RepID=UPI0019D20A3F|nr:CGNR zinc finger domain-containing protein [Streptomyces verrucosisporus]MBN3928185.1 CGNR zinc finger domain-containing protein [Streptomyces verrucosisporus]